MSKPKGRRKPLQSEITSLRPSPDATGPDSFVESDAPLSAEQVGVEPHDQIEEAASRSEDGAEAAPTTFAPGADDPTASGEMAGEALAGESDGAAAPDAPQAMSFDEGDGAVSSNAAAADAIATATDDESASLLDALGVATLGDDGEPSHLGSMTSDADETEAFLSGLLEALLFTSQRPLALKEIARAAGIDRPRARELLERLSESYAQRGVCIEEVAGGYAMRSSPRYAPHIQKFLALRPVRLSRAQLETLAIVAYRQPVTKPEVDDIRGVDSGQVLKGLLERSLLKMVGKKDEPGRPTLYGTTNDFLELLNLRSLSELPTLREYTELSEESRRKFAEETGEAPPEDAAAFQSRLADSNGADAKAATAVVPGAVIPGAVIPGTTDAGEPPTASQLEHDASAPDDAAAQSQPDGVGSEEPSAQLEGELREELAPNELMDHTEVEESEMSVRMTAPGTDADPAPVQHQEVAMDEDDLDEDEEDEDEDEDEESEDDEDEESEDDDVDDEGEEDEDDDDDLDDDDDEDEDDEDEDVEDDEED